MLNDIFAGIIATVVATLILAFYRKKQLYEVFPKMYEFSFFSDNGTVSELRILNKGTSIEEEIVLDINKSKQLELLSASNSGVSSEHNRIKIDRLFPYSEISLIVSIDNGKITSEDLISLTSKTTKGKSYNDLKNVPMSARGKMVIVVILALYSMFFLYIDTISNFLTNIIKNETLSKKEILTNKLLDKRWSNTSDYFFSTLKQNYSSQEFPIRLIATEKDGKIIRATYEIVNKGALPLDVSVKDSRADFTRMSADKCWHNYSAKKTVQPLTAEKITVESLGTEQNTTSFVFDLTYGTNSLFDIGHTIEVEPFKTISDQELTKKVEGVWNRISQNYGFVIVEYYNKSGEYELFVWQDQTKDRLRQYSKGEWSIKNGFLLIKIKKELPKGNLLIDDIESAKKIYDVTNNRLVQKSPQNLLATISKSLPQDNISIHQTNDTQLSKKIIGTWEEKDINNFYWNYTYNANGNVRIDVWINKEKDIKMVTGKGRWKIEDGFIILTIDKVESKYGKKIFKEDTSKIFDMDDKNFTYFDNNGLKVIQTKLSK